MEDKENAYLENNPMLLSELLERLKGHPLARRN